MFEQILLPLDGSPLSERAIPYAIALAGAFGCPVCLFRTTLMPSEPTEASTKLSADTWREVGALERQDALASLERLKDQFLTAEVPVTIGVEGGDPAERILESVRGPVRTLVVMGTHGRGGFSRWVRGSVADRVVRHSPTPVFLVPGFAKKVPPIRRILIPLDGSAFAESILPSALELCRCLRAEAVLLQAYQPEMSYSDWPKWDADRYLGALRDQLRIKEGGPVPIRTAARRGDAPAAIVGYARRKGIDAIAMATHGRSGIGRWALGSVADKVLHTTPVPMLLLRGTRPES
jgi:nucleotide-binding universal stress UspA family protein